MSPQSEVAILPASWTATTLGAICAKPQYGWTTKALGAGEGLKLLRTTDITRGHVTWNSVPFCTDEPADPSRYLLHPGDIVVSRAGSVGASLRLEHVEPAVFASYLIRFRPREGIDGRYVAYFLQSREYWEQIADSSSGIAIPNVNASKLGAVKMPLAPTSEQHRIVAAIEEQFSRLDAGAESLERVRRNLGRIRSSVLKDAVEGRLTQQYSEDESAELLLKRVTDARTPPKHKELPGFDLATLPSLPSGWVWCRAWQVCDLITNGDTPAADKMSSGEGEIPFIKIYNLTANGLLDFETRPTFISRETHLRELRRSRIVPGDVLINIVGPPLGKVARVPSLHSEWNTNQAVVLFRPSEAIDSRLLMLWLMSNPIMDRLTATSKATAGQYNVALSACRLLPMPLPPIAEQERIVTEVERLLTVVSDVDAAVATAHLRREALRRAILASAFEGRLVPQDSSDEPASTLLDRIRDQSLLSGANASGSSRRPRKTR